MPMDTTNVPLEPEARGRAARIRQVITERHDELLHSVALMVSKSLQHLRWADVVDVAQEVLNTAVGEALAHAELFDPARSAAAWIRGVAANVLRDRCRADARARRCVPETSLGKEGWESALSQLRTEPPGEALDPRLDLASALARLPPEDRHVIELRYYQDLDGEQLAQALRAPTSGAARVRLCRALRVLRERLQHAEGEVLP
jgi:RNA polymerase sigma-70 factor (ECF subfamily)